MLGVYSERSVKGTACMLELFGVIVVYVDHPGSVQKYSCTHMPESSRLVCTTILA